MGEASREPMGHESTGRRLTHTSAGTPSLCSKVRRLRCRPRHTDRIHIWHLPVTPSCIDGRPILRYRYRLTRGRIRRVLIPHPADHLGAGQRSRLYASATQSTVISLLVLVLVLVPRRPPKHPIIGVIPQADSALDIKCTLFRRRWDEAFVRVMRTMVTASRRLSKRTINARIVAPLFRRLFLSR